MANVFKRAGNTIIQSAHVIPAFLVFLGCLIIAGMLMYEDYSTSYLGYQALPTAKANPWIIPFVAALPQLGQAAFTYLFLFDTKKRWALLIAASLFILDSGTDIYYKSHGLNSTTEITYAFMESVIIYTIGSELMFTMSFGMVVQLFPRFWEEFHKFLSGFIEGISKIFITFKDLVSDIASGLVEAPDKP